MGIVQPSAGSMYWSAYAELEGSSEPIDPLRFDMYAQRLGNVLLPGITNRVERLRYFGMVCAGLALTRPMRGFAGTQETRAWRRAFLPFEAGWAFANVVAVDGRIKDHPPALERARLKHEFQGLRGANRVLAYFRRTGEQDAVRPHGYTLLISQQAQGGLGSYLVALREYGFVHPDRLELTAFGEELGQAFLSGTRRAERLLSSSPESRRALRRIGEALLLSRPSPAEAKIADAALFQGGTELATVVGRIPGELRRPAAAEEAMRSIARPDGDPLQRAAHYAVDFDPMRRRGLRVFATLGRRLIGRAGLAELTEVADDGLDDEAARLRAAADVLAQHVAPRGLEPVTDLARRLADAESLAQTVRTLLAFHRQEGRRWIETMGPERMALAAPGRFEDPRDDFHGYTLPSALRVYEDVREAM